MHPIARRLLLLALLAANIPAPALAEPRLRIMPAPTASGDLDGDGRPDRAVVVARPAGAGAQDPVFIAVVGAAEHRPHVIGAVRLDDGAVVDRLRLATGRLTAAFRRHYPIDPPGRPTHRTVRSWAFVDGRLHGGTATVGEAWTERLAERLPR